jgi:hypothetical protein
MSKVTRRFILFGSPLLVGVLNLFHPSHLEPTIYEGLRNMVNWWITLHVLNLFGFPLLGVAAYLLVKDQQGVAARIAKVGLAIFIPTYASVDAILGIGTGILVQYAKGVSPDQLAVLSPAIEALWTSTVVMLLSDIGSIAWGLSMFMSAVAFTETKRRPFILVFSLIAGVAAGWAISAGVVGSLPWWIITALIGIISLIIARPPLPASLLILSGILFGTAHVTPVGPLGMACFVLAAALLEFTANKAQITQTVTADSS